MGQGTVIWYKRPMPIVQTFFCVGMQYYENLPPGIMTGIFRSKTMEINYPYQLKNWNAKIS